MNFHQLFSDYNHNSLSIGLVGNFEKAQPSSALIEATLKFLDDAMMLGKLTSDYKIHARQDFSSSGSGKKFMKILQTWPRYSKKW
jgi:hypothetical protein